MSVSTINHSDNNNKTAAIAMARTLEEASVPTRVVSSSSTYHHSAPSIVAPTLNDDEIHHDPFTTNHNFTNDNFINHNINHNVSNMYSTTFPITIRLDAHEEELFDTLLQVADAWEQQQQQQQQQQHDDDNTIGMMITTSSAALQLQLRVAGGWVRDKVLGLPQANDVDITTDVLSGVEFATLVQQHYHQDHHARPGDMTCSSRIGIIAANPDQSKHLETATMRFHFDTTHQPQQEEDPSHLPDDDGNNEQEVTVLDVDFCQLRSQEVYEADSRIPTVTIGTAWEDAQRRDFTMNALFWNVRTRQVEDWTRRGLLDLLHTKTLETPLAPLVTLLEDPLRALRAVRFAVRFGMTLDPALQLAIQQPDLHVALERKISRERVGKELEGMLTGKDAKPVQALELLIDLELAASVFCWVAPNFTSPSPSPTPTAAAGRGEVLANSNSTTRFEGTLMGQDFSVDENTLPSLAPLQRQAWEESRALLHLIPPLLSAYQEAQHQQLILQQEQQQQHQQQQQGSVSSATMTKIDLRLFHLAVYVLPFRDITVDAVVKKKRLQRPLIAYFMHESIKFKNKDVQGITTIRDNLPAMLELLDDVVAAAATNPDSARSFESSILNHPSAAAKLCRAKAGLVLRATKDLWLTCLWVAIVLKLRSNPSDVLSSPHQDLLPNTSPTHTTNWLQVGLEAYRMIMVDLNLDHVWKLKPLLDGDAVIRALSLPRGPLVGKYLEEQVMWMLLNPQGSRQECQEHLLSFKRRMLDEAGGEDDASGTPMTNPAATRQHSDRHISKKFHGDTEL
jgi:tRNA nucleotidyltransferase (CCA-adding enzyme)